MDIQVILSIFIPLLGTTLGAAMVFVIRGEIKPWIEKILLGFAAGVMIAASVWSLIIPAIEMAERNGDIPWLPAAVGFALGIGFLLLLDSIIPHLHPGSKKPEGPKSPFDKSTMLIFAVTLHNIPEGMAVGVVFAGYLTGDGNITYAGALALAIGIAIQNVPEGAVISTPLLTQGLRRSRSFFYGFLSGVVEPLFAFVTIALTALIVPVLPYILSFSAGAMIYVVVEELIPDTQKGKHSNIGTLGVAAGFLVMMILDVALG